MESFSVFLNRHNQTREATRTANIYTRIDPETKEQAELILAQFGIPLSNAIGMFLKQVVIQRGIPFEMKLPSAKPVAIGELAKEQFDAEIRLGMDDIRASRVVSADAVEAEMRNIYGARDISRQLKETGE